MDTASGMSHGHLFHAVLSPSITVGTDNGTDLLEYGLFRRSPCS
jgi:hypothetical protein